MYDRVKSDTEDSTGSFMDLMWIFYLPCLGSDSDLFGETESLSVQLQMKLSRLGTTKNGSCGKVLSIFVEHATVLKRLFIRHKLQFLLVIPILVTASTCTDTTK